MKTLATFLPLVLPEVPGCSDPLAEQAVLSACIEFCEQSLVVQTIEPDNAIVDVPDYDVTVPSSQMLQKVLAVYFAGRQLTPRAKELVTADYAMRGEAVAGVSVTSGTPREWFMRDPAGSTVSIYPPPDASTVGAITICAAFSPTQTATSVADALYTDYARDIAAGAKAILMRMPGQPFSSSKTAKDHEARFQSAISRASRVARVGSAQADLHVVGRRFA
jgi:hypothetical protein